MIVDGVVEGRIGQRLKGVIALTNLNLVTQLTKMLDALLSGPDEIEEPLVLEAVFLQVSPFIRAIIHHHIGWRRGVVVSSVRRMNEVNARRARLVPGWVTVFGRVYHLGM